MTSLLGQDHPVWQDEILRNIPHPAKSARHPAKIEVTNLVVIHTSLSLLPTTLVLIPSVNGRWGHIERGIRPLDLCVHVYLPQQPIRSDDTFCILRRFNLIRLRNRFSQMLPIIKIQTTSLTHHCIAHARWPTHREKILRTFFSMSLTYV
jgi:hypothetical protein